MLRAAREVWVAAVVLAVSLFFLIYLVLATDWSMAVALSPTSMPLFVISLAVLFSLGQLIASVVQARNSGASNQTDTPAGDDASAGRAGPDRPAASRGIALLALTILYLIALPWAGYLMTTTLYTGGLAGLFGNRRPLSIILMMILVPASLLVFFERYLRIWLPAGRLFQ
ncbi:MAG: tripartite tricarboxylate transporter TctB family protein [Trueperaceae bacterium]